MANFYSFFMKKFLPTYLRGLMLSGILVMMSLHSYASHVIGGELRYKYIPNTCDSYQITMFLYGDCNSGSFGAFQGLPVSTPQVCIYDGPTLDNSIYLNLPVPQCGSEVTPVCPDSLSFTTCNNTSYPISGIKKFIYSRTVWLSHRSANWKFVYTSNNGPTGGSYTCGGSLTGITSSGPVSSGRSGSITSISGGSSVQLVTTLNNSFSNPRGHNSSPVLTVEPVPFYCNLYLNCYNPGAVDLYDTNHLSTPTGDSLVFSLVAATNGTGGCGTIGGPVTYVGGLSGANPLTVTTPIAFDPSTGQLCFTPSVSQRSVVVYNIAEYLNDTLGQMSTYAGTGVAGFGGDGASALTASMNKPAGLVMDGAGNIYFADNLNNRIRKISAGGIISTVAGTGVAGYSGDGGTATAAKISNPIGVATDAAGNVYFADNGNNVVRKISTAGIITTIVGNGTVGSGGDGGPAVAAQLNAPIGVFVDAGNNIYVSDYGNSTIRRVNPAGVINRIAGTAGTPGASGDGFGALASTLNGPYGIFVDGSSNIYIADANNNKVRMISAGGIITTVAGNSAGVGGSGTAGFGGDGGKAVAAACQFNHPTGVFVSNQGNLLIADEYNHRVRMVDNCGYVNTLDGNGTAGFGGDGLIPASASLDSLQFVICDNKENIYVSDRSNNRVREVIRNANINKTQVGTMQREMNFLVQPCTYTTPTGKIDTGYGAGIQRIDSTHYYACANSGTFVVHTNPTEPDTTLHITVTATGLGGGFTFGVDSNNTNHPHDSVTGNTATISPGNYTFYLTYTDNHCPLTGTQTIAFSINILPVPTIRDSLVLAATCTDSAKFMIIPGGTGKPWTIKISHALAPFDTFEVFPSDTSAFLDSLPPGSYNLTIFTSVSNECAQNVFMRLDTSKFNIDTSHVNPTYCGAANGSIVIYGMTPGKVDSIFYKYGGVWQPSLGFLVPAAGTDTIRGLLAGAYDSIRVKEGLCYSNWLTQVALTAPILVDPPFTYRTVTTKRPSKCGFCDGIDTLFGLHPGQLDTIKYTYIPWGGVTPTTSSLIHSIGADSMVIISGLCAGQYTNYVVNTAGVCKDSLPGPFNLDSIGIRAGFDTTIHYGCHGDTIMFTNLSSPASDLTYHWYFGDGGTSTAINPIHDYINTTANTVTIKLYITNTKCVDSAFITKTFDNNIHSGFTFLPDPFVCQDTLVTFTNTSSGTNPTYTWIFGDGFTSNATNPTHAYAHAGNYKITLVANENMIPLPQFYTPCYDTFRQNIAVDSNSTVSITTTDSVICQGQQITFNGIYANSGDTQVAWSFGDGTQIYNRNPIIHSFDDTSNGGGYTVTLNVHYRACPSSSATHSVHVFGYPSIYLGPDLAMCPGGAPITIVDERNQNNPYASWLWSTGEKTPGITIVKPGTYVSVVAINGCYASDTVLVQKDCYMDVPNIFSPNGDGTNDFFYPRQLLTKGLMTFKMDIYNRWGQLIYETTNTDGQGWDGNFNNQAQPEGVYVYRIDATFKDGQIEHHTGNVTLIR